MVKVDFTIVQDGGEVTIVRNKTAGQKRAAVEEKSIRVQCFDSKQIDYQEIQSVRTETTKGCSFLKHFKF